MILSGQLPPQLVRLPELNFFNPVTDTSLVFKLIALLTILGFLFRNFFLTTKELEIFQLSGLNKTGQSCLSIYLLELLLAF